MKTILIILTILVSSISLSQNKNPISLGIGFTIPKDVTPYEDMSVPQNMFTNKELSNKYNPEKVFPYFFKPDYGLYHFICLEKTDAYFKVLVNDSDIAYLPNDGFYIYKSWETILFSGSLQRKSRENQIRESASDDSAVIINSCEIESLKVQQIIEVNGEYWLNIYFYTSCDPYDNDPSKRTYGWIKWRTKDKILVNIMLLC